jgi:hypothetical protein
MLPEHLRPFAKEVAALVHKAQLRDAARMVSDWAGIKVKLDSEDPSKTLPPLQNYLHYLLNNNGMEEAAQLLWTPNQFSPEPQYTKDLWKLLQRRVPNLMGSGSGCSSNGYVIHNGLR